MGAGLIEYNLLSAYLPLGSSAMWYLIVLTHLPSAWRLECNKHFNQSNYNVAFRGKEHKFLEGLFAISHLSAPFPQLQKQGRAFRCHGLILLIVRGGSVSYTVDFGPRLGGWYCEAWNLVYEFFMIFSLLVWWETAAVATETQV